VDRVAAVQSTMMTVPLDAELCPERWKEAVDVMLENIPGVTHANKFRIIQLLEADLNQVICIAFARNITKLAKEHSGIISEHQYGRANKTCMTPVLNKLITFQLHIQKRTEEIVFDNDDKGRYDRIISENAWPGIFGRAAKAQQNAILMSTPAMWRFHGVTHEGDH
jgi:hypothetical protein